MFRLTSEEHDILRSQIVTSSLEKVSTTCFYALAERVERKIDKLEVNVTQVFKVVFERLDNLEDVKLTNKNKKKIGLKD